MAEVPVPSLSRAREQKINELSVHFANDDLSLEDLERRIELVYKATSVAELDTITADLTAAAPASQAFAAPKARGSSARSILPTVAEPTPTRVLSLMSTTRRVGRWIVPQKLDVVAIMSDTVLDMTHAVLPAGIADLEIRAVMASLKLVVAPGVRVMVDTHSVMATVQSRADEYSPEMPVTQNAPVIRLTGYAFMADVQVIVRRREEPAPYDEDD